MNQNCECTQPPIPGLLDPTTTECPHPTPGQDELERGAVQWDELAAEAERGAETGIIHPIVAKAQADLYRRTARSLRIQAETGVAVCVCCFKPIGRGNGISRCNG